MEDLFAQKDVGFPSCFGPAHLCAGSLRFITGLLCVQMEEAELRSWIEKLQVRLQACSLDCQQLQTVLESLVMKKQSLCEMLQYWNGRSGCLHASSNILLRGKMDVSIMNSSGTEQSICFLDHNPTLRGIVSS